MMERFALGKASCRVALQRLIQDGLVTSLPRQGYRAAPVTVRDVDEIFELRLALEPVAARRPPAASTGRISNVSNAPVATAP